ncbi:carboxymuconolactone decarboxylase family protein [Actinomycetaceae bacterium TAE3-ERU4]|nr:carboxymuconolactone decarboxylase family protein [Actinomycetaceae bacterium TAE3-ERU4]
MTVLNWMKTHKRIYASLGATELLGHGLDTRLRLLVQLRASFLNRCSYCVDYHSREALKAGFSVDEISLIRNWQPGDTSFNEAESLVLEFASAGTNLSDKPFDMGLQERVIAVYGEKTTTDLIVSIATINAFNRLGVLTGMG